MGLVKPIVPRLRWGHPLTSGLRSVLAFAERGGTTTRDGATLADGTLVNAPGWLTGPYGPHLGFVGGSSQYVNAGPLPWLSGASAFTLIAITKRTTAGDNFPVGIGATLATTVGISGDTNISCRVGSGGGDVYSNTANTTTDWQHIVMAFDGTQGTAINRVALYINALPQSLTMGAGTFPSTAPTSSASLWVGAMEAVSFYGTSECAGVWWYDRTLSQADALAHFADPWGMFETPPVRRMILAGVYAPPAAATVTWNSAEPADGETAAETVDAASIVADPVDAGNPLDTWAATVDGDAVTVDVAGAGGNAERGTVEFFFEFGRTYTIVWTVTTADSHANTYTQEFTVREPVDWGHGTELAEVVVPAPASTSEGVTLIAGLGSDPHSERVEVIAHGGSNAFIELVQITVIEALGDGYSTSERVSLISASRVDIPQAFAARLDAGLGYRTYLAGRLAVEGRGDSWLAGRLEAISARHDTVYPARYEVGNPGESVMAFREEAGVRGDSVYAAREEADGVPTTAAHPSPIAVIHGTVVSRNEARVEAEEG